MLIKTPPKYRRARRVKIRAAEPSPAGPVLVAVAYEQGNWVRLTFDRAIDVSGLVAETVRVSDPVIADTLSGEAPVSQPTAESVQVPLSETEEPLGPDLVLVVAAGNGIVAVDGGAAWAGTAAVEIPFG